jgi:hypothetical protein
MKNVLLVVSNHKVISQSWKLRKTIFDIVQSLCSYNKRKAVSV